MARESSATAPRLIKKRLELPVIIFGAVEVHRLQRELEALEDFLKQAEIRTPGKQPSLPRTSRIMETLAGNNNCNLLVEAERVTLKDFLQEVSTKAPVIHMSFASDPSATFTAKVVAWLRTNIHPYALLQLGLQPTLAAGCVVRTPNKVFDFSLRNRFHDKREVLLKEIGGSESGNKTSASVTAADAAQVQTEAGQLAVEAVAPPSTTEASA